MFKFLSTDDDNNADDKGPINEFNIYEIAILCMYSEEKTMATNFELHKYFIFVQLVLTK